MDVFDKFVLFIDNAQIKQGSLISGATDVAQRVSTPIASAIRDISPFEEDGEPLAFSAGKVIGDLVQKPFVNPNATARKSSKMSDTDVLLSYINKADESALLLREARKLRRRARILRMQREEEEALKKHVENSRYF